MKIRPSIFLLCAVAIALAVLLIWRIKHSTPTSLETTTSPKPTVSIATMEIQPKTNAVTTSNRVTSTSANSTNIPGESKAQQMSEGLSTLNDVPIVFYGKIEDQFSDPVANATVNFGVRIYNGYESTVKSGQITSDANGLFTISGYRGESLGIGVQKSGYAWVSMNGSGIYSELWPDSQRAHPDPNNPTVIKMWKLQWAEPLIGINKEYKLPFIGTPILFDLVSGKVVPIGGDLEAIITRAPGVITQRRQNHGDWSIELLPVNGGIIESDYHTSQVTFEAPADGYQDNYFIQMNHDDPGWYDNIQKAFFMTSRNGQVYSKFSLGFKINDDPNGTMYFQFKGVANTNSSRNWEATASQ
jgi:hypothetical protein